MYDKPQNEASIEDLLKLLEEKPIENNVFFTEDPVYAFVKAFNLERGNTPISYKLLYKLFTLWNKREAVSRRFFCLKLNDIFEKKYETYLLNKKIKEVLDCIDIEKQKTKNDKAFKFVKGFHNNFKKFTEENGIERGDLLIESDILYYMFDTWAYSKNKKQMSYQTFTYFCHLFFGDKKVSTKGGILFGVSEKIKNHIDIQAVLNWRQGRKRSGKNKKYETETNEKLIYSKAENQSETKK